MGVASRAAGPGRGGGDSERPSRAACDDREPTHHNGRYQLIAAARRVHLRDGINKHMQRLKALGPLFLIAGAAHAAVVVLPNANVATNGNAETFIPLGRGQ